METRASPPPPPSGPWLVYSHGEDYQNHTFCWNISGVPSPVEIYHETISAFHDKEILSCSHGWLILYDYNTNLLSLCNSTTFDTTIPLPSLDQLTNNPENQIDSCRLVSSSSSDSLDDDDDFKVVLFVENIPSVMWCLVGDEKWNEISYEKQLNELRPQSGHEIDYGTSYFTNTVICDGKIYAKVCAGGRCWYPDTWLIQIVEEEDGKIALSKLSNFPLFNHAHSEYLVNFVLEACGELYQVGIYYGGIRLVETLSIEIWRLNSGTLIWEPVNGGVIKDTSIFLGDRYCLSCPASEPGFGRIYFTNIDEDNYDRLYCYRIAEESVSMVLPCPDLPKPYSSPFWIMPQVRPKNDCVQETKINREMALLALDEISKEESKGYEKQLTDLPLDLLKKVTNNFIEVDDYLNFRSVSRICRSVAPPLNWLTSLSESKPLLMFADKCQSLYKFVDPNPNSSSNPSDSDDDDYLMRIPKALENTTIRYSNHGWLLLSKRCNVHLYNPLTGAIISYKHYYLTNFCLASMPSGSSYSLVSISFRGGNKIIVSMMGPGEDEWTQKELESNGDTFEETHCAPVLFEDAFYFLGQDGNIGKLKIDESSKDMSWEVTNYNLDGSRPCIKCTDQNFLVECGGELLSVIVSRGRWVHVYKLNQSEGAWKEVKTLGNYALYLSRTSSFSIPTSSGLGNRIYFHSFSSTFGSGIVFFSLETETWHSSKSRDESSDYCYGNRLLLNSCWIKPSLY